MAQNGPQGWQQPGQQPSNTYVYNTYYPTPPPAAPAADHAPTHNAPANTERHRGLIETGSGLIGLGLAQATFIFGLVLAIGALILFVILPAWDGGIKQEGGRRLQNIIEHFDDGRSPDPAPTVTPSPAPWSGVIMLTEGDKVVLRRVNALDESLTSMIQEILAIGYVSHDDMVKLAEKAERNQEKILAQLARIEAKVDEAIESPPPTNKPCPEDWLNLTKEQRERYAPCSNLVIP